MTRPDPACPYCKGLGHYESPVLDDFEPRLDLVRCESCNPVEDLAGWVGLAFIGVLAFLMGLVAWGACQ